MGIKANSKKLAGKFKGKGKGKAKGGSTAKKPQGAPVQMQGAPQGDMQVPLDVLAQFQGGVR